LGSDLDLTLESAEGSHAHTREGEEEEQPGASGAPSENGEEQDPEADPRLIARAERYQLDKHQVYLLSRILDARPEWMQGAGALTPKGVRALAEELGGLPVSEALEELAARVQNGQLREIDKPFAYVRGMIAGSTDG